MVEGKMFYQVYLVLHRLYTYNTESFSIIKKKRDATVSYSFVYNSVIIERFLMNSREAF